MSVITRSTTLTPDEVQFNDDPVDQIRVLSDDHEPNDTMNNAQCAGEEACQSNRSNYADTDKAEDENFGDEDPDFPPMISTRGKQPGSIRYIWDGYVYARDGYTRSFRCSNRQLYECSGRAMIKNGKVRETRAHSHPREPHIHQLEQVERDMIARARIDKSVALRTIYLEACKIEPLVRSHLGLDMMLSKMKKARKEKLFMSSEPYPVEPKKKRLDLDFKWTKDWLQVPSGQNEIAFCKICAKEIVSPTKSRVYNHFLSKIHKRAVLGLYRPPNKKFQIDKQNSYPKDAEDLKKEEPSNRDSDQEDTYDIEVLDQFQDVVERMEAIKRLEREKMNDHSSFYKEVIELQTSPDYQSREKNGFKTLNGQRPESKPEIKLSSKVRISVHVWDSNTGQPMIGLEVSLHKQNDDIWSFVCRIPRLDHKFGKGKDKKMIPLVNCRLTDRRGKCCDLLFGEDLTTGLYKLNLDTQSYYSKLNQRCLYPYVEIIFDVQNTNELYHFPVQLSLSAYNVCRLLKS